MENRTVNNRRQKITIAITHCRYFRNDGKFLDIRMYE